MHGKPPHTEYSESNAVLGTINNAKIVNKEFLKNYPFNILKDLLIASSKERDEDQPAAASFSVDSTAFIATE